MQLLVHIFYRIFFSFCTILFRCTFIYFDCLQTLLFAYCCFDFAEYNVYSHCTNVFCIVYCILPLPFNLFKRFGIEPKTIAEKCSKKSGEKKKILFLNVFEKSIIAALIRRHIDHQIFLVYTCASAHSFIYKIYPWNCKLFCEYF